MIEAYLGAPEETIDDGAAPSRPDGDALLEVKDLDVHYGGIHALKGVSLRASRRARSSR